jgi:hypothetical protein
MLVKACKNDCQEFLVMDGDSVSMYVLQYVQKKEAQKEKQLNVKETGVTIRRKQV